MSDTEQQDPRAAMVAEAYAQRLARLQHENVTLAVELELAQQRIEELTAGPGEA